MKVVIIGPYGREGSVKTITAKLAEHLSYNNRIYVITYSLNLPKFSLVNGVSIYNIYSKKIVNNPILINSLVNSIKTTINEIDPDIIHLSSTFAPYSIAVTNLSNRYPSLLTLFGLLSKVTKFRGLPRDFYGMMSLLGEKYTISKIQNIVVESKYNMYVLRNFIRNDLNIFVIPSGVDFKEIKLLKNEIDKSLDENLDILYIGRLSKEKGVDVLIKSVKIAVKKKPDIRVVIAGKGPLKNELIKITKKLDLNRNIKFVGYISDLDKFRYYRLCKIVVVPSRWDFSPITIPEAMAFRKPVIASNMTNSDLVIDGKTGYLFNSENFYNLAEKIILLLEDESKRVKLGERAYKLVKRFDWKSIAHEYLKVYKSI